MDATPDTVPAILYVDDEQQACKWFARTFSGSYSVLTANSVEEAKAMLRDAHDRIGVVLTDFRMPGGDGDRAPDLFRPVLGPGDAVVMAVAKRFGGGATGTLDVSDLAAAEFARNPGMRPRISGRVVEAHRSLPTVPNDLPC